MMPLGQPLLMPVRLWFIWGSLLIALLLNMLPLGRSIWLPDVVAVVLVFWNLHQPRKIGMVVAFLLGLCMDVHQTALLGQHAAVYVVLAFATQAMHRRLLWFSVGSQALQLLPWWFALHGVQLLLRLASGGVFPGYGLAIAPLLETLLWPFLSALLLWPQKRSPNVNL